MSNGGLGWPVVSRCRCPVVVVVVVGCSFPLSSVVVPSCLIYVLYIYIFFSNNCATPINLTDNAQSLTQYSRMQNL